MILFLGRFVLRLVPLELGKVEECDSAVLGLDLHNAGGLADGGLFDEHGILAGLSVGAVVLKYGWLSFPH